MGLRDVVAKTILTQLIIKGALGCKTLTLTLELLAIFCRGVGMGARDGFAKKVLT